MNRLAHFVLLALLVVAPQLVSAQEEKKAPTVETPENTPPLSKLNAFPERYSGKHFYFQKVWVSGKVEKHFGEFLLGAYDEKDTPIFGHFRQDGIAFQLHPDVAEQILDNQKINPRNRYRAHVLCTVHKASVVEGTQQYWAAYVHQIDFLNMNNQVLETIKVKEKKDKK